MNFHFDTRVPIGMDPHQTLPLGYAIVTLLSFGIFAAIVIGSFELIRYAYHWLF